MKKFKTIYIVIIFLIALLVLMALAMAPKETFGLNKVLTDQDYEQAIALGKDKINFITNCQEWVITENVRTSEGVLILTPYFNIIWTAKKLFQDYYEPTVQKMKEGLIGQENELCLNVTVRGNNYEFLEDSHMVVRYKDESNKVENSKYIIVQPESVTIGYPEYKIGGFYTNSIFSLFDIRKIPNQLVELIVVYKNGYEKVYFIDFSKIR